MGHCHFTSHEFLACNALSETTQVQIVVVIEYFSSSFLQSINLLYGGNMANALHNGSDSCLCPSIRFALRPLNEK